METYLIFHLMLGGFLGFLAGFFATGNWLLSFLLCLLFGPLGFFVVLSLEYAITVKVNAEKDKIYCPSCKNIVSRKLFCCPYCQAHLTEKYEYLSKAQQK